MTESVKIILGLIALVAVGGGLYYANQQPKKIPQPNVNGDTTQQVDNTQKKMAFSQFSSQDKGNYKCTVSQYVQDIQSEGTVYLSNGMIRGEFITQYNGQPIDSTFIMRDGYTYTWSSAMKNMGFKVKAEASTSTEVTTSGSASGTYSANLDQIGDYTCEAWTPDETKFVPPTTITFTAM